MMLKFKNRRPKLCSPRGEGDANDGSQRRLCRRGRLKEALHILLVTEKLADSSTYDTLLQGCLNYRALPEGKLVHAHMIQTGFKCEAISLGNKLVTIYAKCASLVDARRVFDQMPERDVISCTMMIASYARHSHAEEALTLFYEMQRTGIQPNNFTFASVLPACGNMAALKEVHDEIIRAGGFESDVFVGSALVDMYAKCGMIENARVLFDKIPQRNLVSWNAMISGYAQNGCIDEALQLFKKMPERNVVSWTSVISGYAQNGDVDAALKLFQKMPERNVFSWNAMIAGYAQNGYGDEALKLFRQMQRSDVKPNSKTFVSVLPACANVSKLEQGKKIHEEIIKMGFQFDVYVGTALVDMYAKCGNLEEARDLFDKMPQRYVVSWNAMIAGYAQNGFVDDARKLFQKMPRRNSVSWNAMIAGYAQNGYFHEALKLFQEMPERNLASWNAMIAGYAQNGQVDEAMKLFKNMPERDNISWTAMVTGYAKNGHVDEAKKLFQKIPNRTTACWTAMIAGYAQNGLVNEALKLFQKIPKPNVVLWNAMIAGYAQNAHSEEALKIYRQMQKAGVKPNSKTFPSVLQACGNLASLEQGKDIHDKVNRNGFQCDVIVGNSLIDMYAKCGSIENARNVFDRMPQRDVVSWTTIIAGYAMYGCGKEALNLFQQMQHSGTRPDHVTLVGVLYACCHAGLVDEGKQHFDHMSQYYHITPAMEHYRCMVDLLARAGRLDEARDFINKMPIKPDATVWGSLLGACRTYNNVELGERVAKHVWELDPKNATPYVLLCNIYAAAGRWDAIEKMRKMMKDGRVKKQPGYSWIEVNKQVHAFLVGDRSHPQTHKIYAKLEKLSGQMKVAGYVPAKTQFVLNDVEEEQKEQILVHHSEKLAIAFGLINTSPETSIRIIKNLRVCSDCHSAIKIISKIVLRDIYVRDSSCFHHFKDGQCSCGDYW
eukprot:Gb_13952 [translate_table: standard]